MHTVEMAKIGTYGKCEFFVLTEPLHSRCFHIRHPEFEIVVRMNDWKLLEIKYNISHRRFNIGKDHKAMNRCIGVFVKREFIKQKSRVGSMTNGEAMEFAWKLLNE